MIEIRIPTFKNPALLRRALSSLEEQTLPSWRGVVLEDSPGNEGLPVVESISDSRIEHRECRSNRGLVQNLQRAFSPKPFFKESRYACVLEDDNYFRPTFLEHAIESLGADHTVFQGTAQKANFFGDGRGNIRREFSLRDAYGDKPRLISLTDRLQSFPDNKQPVANLGLVWKLEAGSWR